MRSIWLACATSAARSLTKTKRACDDYITAGGSGVVHVQRLFLVATYVRTFSGRRRPRSVSLFAGRAARALQNVLIVSLSGRMAHARALAVP